MGYCRNCIYFRQKESTDGWYDIRTMYSCTYHKLSNGELMHPDSQVSCQKIRNTR